MAEKHMFSTGVLRVGPAGATALTASNKIGVVQDISLESSVDRVEMFDAAVNAVYAVDTADHEAHAKMKCTSNDISLAIKQYTSGAAVVGNVATWSKTSKPAACRVELDVTDNQTGAVSTYVATNAKFKGDSVSYKQKAFADMSLEADFYPDATSGTVMTRTDN